MRIFFLLLTCRVTLPTVFHFSVVSDIVYRNGSSINAPDCKRFFYIPPVIETAYQSSRVYRKFMNFRDNSLSLFLTWKSCGLLTFPLAPLSDRRRYINLPSFFGSFPIESYFFTFKICLS